MYWTPAAGPEKHCSSFISETFILPPMAWSWTRKGLSEHGEKLQFAVQGSIFDARINPLASIGLLYLNPPYDWDEGERVEMKFLKHAHKWLCTDGVLVFLVPELIFLYEKHRSWIGQHFYDGRIVRATKADYPAFKQVVLFGKKRKERHETGAVGSPPYPHIEDVEASSYVVPLTSGPGVFQGTDTVTDEEVAGHWPNVVREIESICRQKRHNNAAESPPSSQEGAPDKPAHRGHPRRQGGDR